MERYQRALASAILLGTVACAPTPEPLTRTCLLETPQSEHRYQPIFFSELLNDPNRYVGKRISTSDLVFGYSSNSDNSRLTLVVGEMSYRGKYIFAISVADDSAKKIQHEYLIALLQGAINEAANGVSSPGFTLSGVFQENGELSLEEISRGDCTLHLH